VKESLRLLVGEVRPDDRIALVVYAGSSGLVLPSTPAAQRSTILAAIAPDGDLSRKLEWPLLDAGATASSAAGSTDFRFASAVAAFGLVLRGSDHRGTADLALVRRLAQDGLGPDQGGHRRSFLQLVDRAETVAGGGWPLGGDQAGRGQLVITQDGRRKASLQVQGQRLRGDVRGTSVQVAIKPVEIEGHMAGEPVWIWMHGREAEGHIGGHRVGFTVTETPTGHLLRGTGVGHTIRLEEAHGRLSWLPSCERPLLRIPTGRERAIVYQGACASGGRMRVILPDAFDVWPPLPRLILLSLLLTEQDPVLRARARGLFPAKDAR
jgi:hypothetical protein